MPTFTAITMRACFGLAAAVSFIALAAQPAHAQAANTTFFVTSNGVGNGANLGGVAGADNHCQTLAQAAGAGLAKPGTLICRRKPADGKPAVNARDRIGKGPWQNAKGVVVAKDDCRFAQRRRQQPHQADRFEREGRRHQRPRRYAEPP